MSGLQTKFLLLLMAGALLTGDARGQVTQEGQEKIEAALAQVTCAGNIRSLGVLVGDGSWVLTAFHAFKTVDTNNCTVSGLGNLKSRATPVGAAGPDFLLFRLETPADHPGAAFSSALHKQQTVFAVHADDELKIMQGMLQGTRKLDADFTLFVTSLQFDANSNGGGLFTACGDVIGINLDLGDGHLSIPIAEASGLLQSKGVQIRQSSTPCSADGGSAGNGPDGNSGGSSGGGTTGGEQQGGEQPAPQKHGDNTFMWIVLGVIAAVLIAGSSKNGRAAAQNVYHSVSLGYSHRHHPSPGQHHVFLSCVSGPLAGSRVPLSESEIFIGRDPAQCQVLLPQSVEKVSRRHCSLRLDYDGSVLLEDCGSSNGTYLLTGERLQPGRSKSLRNGDRFYLGVSSVMFEIIGNS